MSTLPVEAVADENVGGPLKHIVAPHHGAAVGPDGLGKADGIARLLQLAQRRLAGPCAVHVEDAHGGLLDPAGLSGDDAVNGVEDHALQTVGAGGAGGGGQEHGLTTGGRYYPSHSGHTDGEKGNAW